MNKLLNMYYNMFLTVFYYSLISFIFIFVVHYLYEYFKENLTIPKEKDLIEKPRETYNKIYQTLQNQENNIKTNNEMKNELKNYLNELKKNNANQNMTQNDNVDTFNGNIGFSAINDVSNDIESFTPF